MLKVKAKLLSVILLTCTTNTLAQGTKLEIFPTIVIHDSNKAELITELLDSDITVRFKPDIEDLSVSQSKMNDAAMGINSASEFLATQFPVKSQFLKSQKLPGRHIAQKIELRNQSLFIIGMDKYSLDWLSVNKKELVRLNALGLIAEAENLIQYQELQRLAHPLILMPKGVDAVAQELKVPTYPILITKDGFWQ